MFYKIYVRTKSNMLDYFQFKSAKEFLANVDTSYYISVIKVQNVFGESLDVESFLNGVVK